MNEYLGRITSQHRIRPKYIAWISALLEKAEDSSQLMESVNSAFDIEHAQGVQLDCIGEIVGVSRLLNFEPKYTAPLLSDKYYRVILKAKISLNQWDGTMQGIQELWDGIYEGYKLEVIDHQDMSITLRVKNLDNLFENEFINHGYLAPKPVAVQIRYKFVFDRRLEETLYHGGIMRAISSIYHLTSPQAQLKGVYGDLFSGGCLSMYCCYHLPVAERSL